MEYARLLKNYSLSSFLKELDIIEGQELNTKGREEKLRFIGFVIRVFQLKIRCFQNSTTLTDEWKQIQYVNFLSFFGSRDILQNEIKLRALRAKWKDIIDNDLSLKAQKGISEVILAGEE